MLRLKNAKPQTPNAKLFNSFREFLNSSTSLNLSRSKVYFYNMLKALIQGLIIALISISGFGQGAREYVFNHIDKTDGLASNGVTCAMQDHNGYLWFGTSRGLYRFDGTHVKNFTKYGDGNEAFPIDIVTDVIEDRKHNLWIRFAAEQIGVLNPNTNKFRRIKIDRSQVPNMSGIAKMVIGNDDNVIFVNAGDAIYTYDSASDEFSSKHNFIHLPKDWAPYGINYDSTNSCYWIGSNKGLAKYNLKTKILSYTGNNVENEFVIDGSKFQTEVSHVATDKLNRKWVISWPGAPVWKLKAICHDPANKTRKEYDFQLDSAKLGYYEILGITVQRNGTVWMYGLSFIAQLNENDGNFQFLPRKYTGRHSIEYDNVFDIYNDREENLWVCTDKGVYVFNPEAQVFKKIKNRLPNQEVKDNSVNSILYTRNNEIWVATWGEGIFVYDSSFKPIERTIAGGLIWQLCQRRNGDIWIGEQGGGLKVYDPATRKMVHRVPAIFKNRTIRQIYEDPYGKIWIGTQGGRVVRWDPELGKDNFEDGFVLLQDLGYIVYDLTMDSKGFVWVCVEAAGLYKLDGKNGRVIDHYTRTDGKEKSLFYAGTSGIAEVDDSLMLVLNRGISILNTNTKTFKHIGVSEGLSSNNVHSLVKDKMGYFWMGTDEGVLRYNFQKNIITTSSHEEGLVESRIMLAAVDLFPDGRIAMGTEHDMLVFDPGKAFPDLEVPPVQITDFQIGSKFLRADSVMEQKHITVEYGKTSMTIFYSSISQLQKSQLRYYYMLEGLDKDWIAGDPQQKSQYSFVPSGHYVFKVKAVNAYGKSSEESRLKIYVRPPFWRTPWFYGLLVLIAAIIVYQYYKGSIQRRRNEDEIRNRIATNLHESLSATLASVNVLGEMAKMKIDRDAEGAKDYISKITRSTSNSMEAMDDILWGINPENDSMLKTAERMKKIANEMLSLKNIAYNFNIDETVLRMRMDMQYRNGLLGLYKTIIKEVAENSECYQVNIDFQRSNGHLQLSVEDDGKGYNLEDTEVKRGVEEFNRKVRAIRGSVDVQSQPGKGTRVVLTFET